MKITKKVLAVILATIVITSGTYVAIKVHSANTATAEAAETQTQQAQVQVIEPEIVDETPEFSEDETTTEPTTEPITAKKSSVGKTVTKAAAPVEEFAEVSEVAVFSQQEIFVEEPAEEETVTEETTEETTGYEPVYDDPLPPEGADWIE